ncbi:MAG: hypothetical protein M1831_001020 [Alyxoria varia]|nr:MAG: hypothetical protein M1831_001020 [Alyxoria varia]
MAPKSNPETSPASPCQTCKVSYGPVFFIPMPGPATGNTKSVAECLTCRYVKKAARIIKNRNRNPQIPTLAKAQQFIEDDIAGVAEWFCENHGMTGEQSEAAVKRVMDHVKAEYTGSHLGRGRAKHTIRKNRRVMKAKKSGFALGRKPNRNCAVVIPTKR